MINTVVVLSIALGSARRPRVWWHEVGIVQLCAKFWKVMCRTFDFYARSVLQIMHAIYQVIYYTVSA